MRIKGPLICSQGNHFSRSLLGDYALVIIIIITIVIIIKFKRQLDLKEQLPPVGDEAVAFVHVYKENQLKTVVTHQGLKPIRTRWEEKALYGRCPSPIKNADVDKKVLKAEFRNKPNSPHNPTKAYHHYIINNNFLKIYIVQFSW